MRWLLAIALATACVAVLRSYDDVRATESRDVRLYFPNGRFLREAACGFREVAADYLWFQTVQYYGGYRKGEHDSRYFDLLIDGVTQLDPRFVEAYYFAALVACLDFGDIPRAVDILRRGILHNPQTASLRFHVGFMYYVFEKNFARASMWIDSAARQPDATEFHERFAAYARRRAGDLEGSLALWCHLRDTTRSTDLRRVAEEHIAKLEEELREHGGGPAPVPTPRRSP
jgi:hypothetical protein